jgi:hypothetical protein
MPELPGPVAVLQEVGRYLLLRFGKPGLEQVVEVPAERLFLGPAVHGLSGAVPEGDPVFGVAHHDRVLRQVEQDAVVLLALR